MANRKISSDFKRKVVLDVLSGELSKEGARRVYNIRGKSSVSDWLRQYGQEFPWLQSPAIGLPPMSNESDSEVVERLKAQVRELQQKLETEKHKSGLFETLINVAEEHFKIAIRKKPGAKQSIDTKSNNRASQ